MAAGADSSQAGRGKAGAMAVSVVYQAGWETPGEHPELAAAE